MADSLETEQGRFDYYKEKLIAEKATVPELTGIPLPVLDVAMRRANFDEFPPLGIINFREVPGDIDEEKFVDKKIDDVLRGTVKYLRELESQHPAYIETWGINLRGSESERRLLATTRTELRKIEEEISNLERGEETEFDNPAMQKLSNKNLGDLLDGTLLNFLKEIGVNRTQDAVKRNDDLILENYQKIYDFLSKESTPPPTTPLSVDIFRVPDTVNPATIKENIPARISETEKMEPVQVSPVPATPAIPASPSVAPAPNTSGSVAVSQKQDVTVTVVEKAQPPIEPANQGSNTPQNITAAETTNIAETETGSVGKSSTGVSTPLLDILGASAGMKSEDIAKMFQGEGAMEKLQQSLDLSFPGTSENTEAQIAPAVNQAAGAAKIETPSAAQTAIKRSEPTKMAEQVQAPPPPPAAPTPQPEVIASTTQENAQLNTTATGTEEKPKEIPPAQETSSTGDNKGQIQTNDELLKVMREVLKTLQGPLIFTDGKHNFS